MDAVNAAGFYNRETIESLRELHPSAVNVTCLIDSHEAIRAELEARGRDLDESEIDIVNIRAKLKAKDKQLKRAIEIAREALSPRPECEHDNVGICSACRSLFSWGERTRDRKLSELDEMEKDGGI